VCILGLTAATASSVFAHQRRHGHHRHHHHRRHHRRHKHRRTTHARIASSSPVGLSHPTLNVTAGSGAVGAAGAPGFSPAQITGTTYYVSPTGSDTNPGTSPALAWKTIDRVNRATLNPGDGVLFQGGATFSDDSLMPGWGTGVNGTPSAPVVFGSYGQGIAALPQGIWMKGEHDLVFQNFDLGPTMGVSGTGSDITVQGCNIHDEMQGKVPSGWAELGIVVTGSNWLIRNNTISRTGDSGMLLTGDHFTVTGNTIDDTGLDPAITYGDHGIYDKSVDSTITYNTINGYHNDGVSVRYRNANVSHNLIENGEIALAWFQYDTQSGTTHWTGNTIIGDTVAAMYVSPSGSGGDTHESFVITGNTIKKPANAMSYWVAMNLHPTSGSYTVNGNNIAS
jgi:hypothetical protein